MNVLIEGMSSHYGGLETFIMTTLRCLNSEEFKFEFLTYDEHIAYEDELTELGCTIHVLPKRSVSYSRYVSELDKLFSSNKYDVFWSNRTTLSAIEPFKMASKYQVPKIICHGHASKNMGTTLTYVLHQFNRRMINRYITDKFACSDGAVKWFYGNDSNATVIQNAVNIDTYRFNESKRKAVRQRLGLSDEIAVCNIARLNPEKNQMFLLDIFISLLEIEPNARLFLCGEGLLKQQLIEKIRATDIEEHVSFLGIRHDIPDLLQAFDVMVLPSLFEGLPFVLVEGQAASLPCLVSDAVSKQSQLTTVLSFLSLSDSPKIWAEKALKMAQMERVDTEDQLKARGFDLGSFAYRIKQLLSAQQKK